MVPSGHSRDGGDFPHGNSSRISSNRGQKLVGHLERKDKILLHIFGITEFTCLIVKAGCVEFAHVELQANDGKNEDGKEKKQANLQQRNHGLHDGFQHHL